VAYRAYAIAQVAVRVGLQFFLFKYQNLISYCQSHILPLQKKLIEMRPQLWSGNRQIDKSNNRGKIDINTIGLKITIETVSFSRMCITAFWNCQICRCQRYRLKYGFHQNKPQKLEIMRKDFADDAPIFC